MTTIIDKSLTVSTLDVGTLATTVIQHDAGSPPGPVVITAGEVTVGDCAHLDLQGQGTLDTNSLDLRIDSTITVTNGSVLDVNGAVQTSTSSQTNIGNKSTVELGSTAGLTLLSGMSFIGSNATLKIAGSEPITSSEPGVRGFGATDTIDFLKSAGVTHMDWTQNSVQGQGVLELLNAQNAVVGSLALAGTYTTANFTFASDHHGGTNITFHA
jgi:hypothetical protein